MLLPLRLRLKLFNKLAQDVPGSPASPTSPASPSSPSSPDSPTAPNQPTSTTAVVKQPSQPATSMMNLSVGWPNWGPQLNTLISKIDRVIIAGTNQKYNFNDLFINKFPSGVDTEFPPPNPTKDVISFARIIYTNIMNSGISFRGALPYADMRNRIASLLNAPQLLKFQQINTKGPLRNLGADLSSLRESLLAFYNSIPVS